MASENIQLPGQAALLSVAVLNEDEERILDLINLVESCTIIESIDNDSLIGAIRLSDTTDTISTFPLRGDEPVVITWLASDIEKECVFRITNITNIGISIETPGAGIEIDMISEYAYKQEFHNIDSAFSSTIKSAAESIHSEVLSDTFPNSFRADEFKIYNKDANKITVDETLGVLDFIIPSETPFDAMNYLLAWASNPESSKSGTWMFFQTLDGFKFTTMEALFSAPLKDGTHSYILASAEDPLDPTSQYSVNNIRQLKRSNLFILAKTGRFCSQVKELSYTHKRVQTTEYTFFDEDYELEGKELLVSDKIKNTIGKVPTETHWVYRDSTTPDFSINDILPHKWAMHSITRNNTMQIKVAGNPSLIAGDVLELIVNRSTSVEKDGARPEDKTLSGKYIIKDIVHMFSPSTYKQDITLIRPGAVDAGKVET